MLKHHRIVYDFVRRFNGASLQRNWRLDLRGGEHLDISGPAILAFNHGHIVDGSFVMPILRRRVRFLCDHRALTVPLLGQALRLIDVIPVHVERPDPAAALAAARTLERGRLLAIFPEAKVKGDGMIRARPGVAWLADRLSVPVIPIAMWGAAAFNRPFDVYVRRVRPRVAVIVGEPLTVALPDGERRNGLQPAADAVMLTIAERLPERYRGAYAEGGEGWRRGREALERGWVRPRQAVAAAGQPRLPP